MMQTCLKEEDGSQEDLDPFIKHEKLTSYKSKCILECIFDKLKHVSVFYRIFLLYMSHVT